MDVYYNNELLNSKESCVLGIDTNPGSTYGFSYIKCSNGLAIIIGQLSVYTDGKVGTYEKDADYPFQFASTPALSLSVNDHNSTVYTTFEGIYGFGVSLNLKKTSSSVNVVVRFFTIGKYE